MSRTQICIGVACDDIHVYCVLEGFGKPSQKKTYESFKDHIEPGSTLIHGMDNSHQKLIRKLGLKEKAYDSKTIKKLPDKLNPLNKVNTIHSRIKKFFYARNSFNRASIKGYIDLFSFMMNSPETSSKRSIFCSIWDFEFPNCSDTETFIQINCGFSSPVCKTGSK